VIEEKQLLGCAHLFGPRTQGRTWGDPSDFLGLFKDRRTVRGTVVESHISRKTSEMWGTQDLLLGKKGTRHIPLSFKGDRKAAGQVLGHPGFFCWVEAGNLTLLQRE
jgi:hypothetical protein